MAIDPVSFKAFENDFEGFSRDLGASFERYGFAVVADHDLNQRLVDGALVSAKAFFALPDAVKQTYRVSGGGGQRGYTAFGVETAKGAEHFDLKEFWHVGRSLPAGHPYRAAMPDNLWPDEVPEFQETVGKLYEALDGVWEIVFSAL